MFYAKFMFVKKGPLSKVWLAAHGSIKKVPKAQLMQTDITASVKSILEPSGGPLALRLSGQLLLGVVRIYKSNIEYLAQDCTEARTKLKLVYKPGAVDLPAGASQAPANAITLAERGDVFNDMPLDIDLDADLLLEDEKGSHFILPEASSAMERGRAADLRTSPPRGADLIDDDLIGNISKRRSAANARPADMEEFNERAEIELFQDDDLLQPLPSPAKPTGNGKAEIKYPDEDGVGGAAGDYQHEGTDMQDTGHDMVDRGVELDLGFDVDAVQPHLDGAMGAGAASEDALPGEVTTDEKHVDGDDDAATGDKRTRKRPTGAAAAAEDDAQETKGKQVRKRRKREAVLAVDEKTELAREVMREQMKDTSDIVGRPIAVPATPLSKRQRQSVVPSSAAELFSPSLAMSMAPQMQALFEDLVSPAVKGARPSQAGGAADAANRADADVKMTDADADAAAMMVDQGMDFVDRGDGFDFGVDEHMQAAAGDGAGGNMSLISSTSAASPSRPSRVPADGPDSLADAVFRSTGADDGGAASAASSASGTASSAAAAAAPADEPRQEGFSARTVKCYDFLKRELQSQPTVSFEATMQASRHPRQTAASLFYELLVLKTHDFIAVDQPAPYGDIEVSKTQHFEDPLPETADGAAAAAPGSETVSSQQPKRKARKMAASTSASSPARPEPAESTAAAAASSAGTAPAAASKPASRRRGH